jgi:hypothetical protein
VAGRFIGGGEEFQKRGGGLAGSQPLQHRGWGVRPGQGLGERGQVGGDVSVVDGEELTDTVAGLAAWTASCGVEETRLPAAAAGAGAVGWPEQAGHSPWPSGRRPISGWMSPQSAQAPGWLRVRA